MLPPHELKNKEFTKAIRGYTATEVDEHIDFMIEKYTELYKANDELERKLRTALAQLDTYKSEEESIRSALVNAQKASAGIINEANEKADVIVRSAKNNCDKILSELRAKVQKEQDTLEMLKRSVADFKDHLFEEYQAHIDMIEKIAPESELQPEDDNYQQDIIDGIKDDIAAVVEDGVFDTAEIPAVVIPEEEIYAEEIPEEAESEEEPAKDSLPESDEAAEESPDDLMAEPEEISKDLPADDFIEALAEEIEADTIDISESGITAEETGAITDLSIYQEAAEESANDPIPEDDAKTIVIERSQAAGREHSAGVRDTIRALNKKFLEEKDDADPFGKTGSDESDDDETDREFLRMIRNATNDAQKRQEIKQKNNQSENKSETSEFERVYGKIRK